MCSKEKINAKEKAMALKQRHELMLEANFPHEGIEAIERVLQRGSKKYPPANWRTEPCERHMLKALGHLLKVLTGVEHDNEDSLEHALCRIAMAVATRPDQSQKR